MKRAFYVKLYADTDRLQKHIQYNNRRKPMPFQELLSRPLIYLDGGTGTMLQARGLRGSLTVK